MIINPALSEMTAAKSKDVMFWLQFGALPTTLSLACQVDQSRESFGPWPKEKSKRKTVPFLGIDPTPNRTTYSVYVFYVTVRSCVVDGYGALKDGWDFGKLMKW